MRLENLLSRLPCLKNEITDISTLNGGISNHNFLVKTHFRDYYLRIPGNNRNLYLSTTDERINTEIAAKYGVTVPNSYIDLEGCLVREYVHGKIIDKWNHDRLEQAAALLYKLHTIPEKFNNNLDFFEFSRVYIDLIKRNGGTLPKYYKDNISKLDRLEESLSKTNPSSLPCHNDPGPFNFIESHDKLILIDFEYSGNGDPARELAYFTLSSELDEKMERSFLKAYGAKDIKGFMDKYYLYKPLCSMMFALWGRMQYALNNMNYDLKTMESLEKKAIKDAENYFKEVGI